MKTAIVTGDYFKPGETFVNRHIAHIFGTGAACLVVGRYYGEDPIGRPLFVRRSNKTAVEKIQQLWMLPIHRRRYGTSRPPFGPKKAELKAFLREHEVEVILSEFGTQAVVMTPLAQEMGIPIFTYFRGTDASRSLRRSRTLKAYRIMFPNLAGVFSVSQFLLDNLAAHGIRHDNAHVIPSGVDIRRFQPGTKRPLSCLAVGRMVQKKAPLITIQAFADATKDLPEARLTMIGDGPLMEKAQALVAQLGLQDRIALPGALPHDTVRQHLAEAQLFLQHSITADDGNTEGLPTAIQEAMAAGCVVVSTRHAGIPEAVLDGETGYLVAEHDAAAYTDRIRQALTSPQIDTMAQTARRVAEDRFDNGALLTKLETEIRATLAR